jgi:chloramphenicol-sensitive protein RarD
VTSLPLLWSVEAARRLRYVSLGFFQYLAPTLQLLLAVFAFGEHFTRAHGVAFSLIGAAALLYAWPGPGASRAKAPPTAVPPEE